MSEKKALENNEVMLWGERQVSPELLKDYDKGNKNPKSKAKILKDGDTDKKIIRKAVGKRIYNNKEIYTIDDLDFLNKEYDRIEEEASNLTDFSKMDELVEVQDEIYNLIQKLTKEKEKEEEKEYNEPSKTSSIDFEEIKKLMVKLEQLREDYIQSRGNASIRQKMEDIEAKIEQLGRVQKPVKTGKGITVKQKIIDIPLKNIDYEIIEKIIKMVGKGFKKGSPEAIAHAERMRKAREAKKKPIEEIEEPIIQKKEGKARVQKGSEEAKALSRKLVEAKKAKKEAKQKEEEEMKRKEALKNPIKPKGRPWYYIGDIPKGYREATETEAIKNKKVSKYGKYEVDNDKYFLWINYEILLDENKTQKEIGWSMQGLKRRIIDALQNIEIYKSKIDNDKYESKKEDFNNKLVFEKEKRKYLQYGYDWYDKLLHKRYDIKYERTKIKLPEIEHIEPSKKSQETTIIKANRPIDPRTGKEAEISIYDGLDDNKEEIKEDADVELMFIKGNDIIGLSTKYFTENYKLKKGYSKKLIKKGIVLAKKHYETDDYKNNVYHMIGGGFYNKI
jgi:hypothetical protein